MSIFDEWNRYKKQLNTLKRKIHFHEREIWFCYLGKNVGHEQDGGEAFLRPVIILKKFNKRLFWGIPLTLKSKEGTFYILTKDNKNKERTAILSQLKLLDVNRLKSKLGQVALEEFQNIKKTIRGWLS